MQAHFFSQTSQPEINAGVAAFVSARIKWYDGDFGPCCTLGVFKNDRLVAGVVYSDYRPNEGTIELSAAADNSRWMSRSILTKLLDMPFARLGCQALIARHDGGDLALRRMWKRVGAVEYMIPRLNGRAKPPVALTVLTDDAWLASDFKKAV